MNWEIRGFGFFLMSRTGYWFERKLLMLTAVLVKFYMYFLTKEVVKIVAFWIAITDNQNQKNSEFGCQMWLLQKYHQPPSKKT